MFRNVTLHPVAVGPLLIITRFTLFVAPPPPSGTFGDVQVTGTVAEVALATVVGPVAVMVSRPETPGAPF